MTKAKENKAFPAASEKEVIDARAEGVKDAIQESTKDAYLRGADQEYGNEPEGKPAPQIDHAVLNIRHLVDLPPDDLKAVLDGKDGAAHPPLSEGKIIGLLEIERSGQNRTDVVQALVKHLGGKSPYEFTDAGPNYTNDVSRTAL